MKLYLECPTCLRKHGNFEAVMTVEIREDNLYNVTCPIGHESLVFISNPKFEVLFEIGATALLDGYTREAVVSIASALERFYEFYLNLMARKYNISVEEFEKCWSIIAKQSERQLGAFLFLYLIQNQSAVFFKAFLKKKVGGKELVTFRNDVVHNGHIPTHDNAVTYGEHVFTFISSVMKQLMSADDKAFGMAMIQTIPAEWRAAPENVSRVYRFHPTVMNHSHSGVNASTFVEALEILKKHKRAGGI